MIKAQIPEDLILELEQHFPPKCAAPDETPAQIHHYAGRAFLVSYLRRCHDLQKQGQYSERILP